ncbi:MAG TPA: NAD-dependent deacylase [Steroidobacteraceae bacterium]|nr:NAD-dependent deacylase [Steroidobacteraceae bacterium]
MSALETPRNCPDRLVETLRSARDVLILTGAGISAESGLPTFREPLCGLWERFNPQDLATPGAFARDPALVWGWYEWRRMKAPRAAPNAAHGAIRDLQNKLPQLTLVTQNVDDLHERAGTANVVHLHGRLSQPYCEDCRQSFTPAPEIPDEPEHGRRLDPPRCSACGSRIRPGVVWFGEPLPQGEWNIAECAADRCDVFFCVGTSAVVYPAASLIERAAARGVTTVQVNPGGSDWDTHVSYNFRCAAGAMLPELLKRL